MDVDTTDSGLDSLTSSALSSPLSSPRSSPTPPPELLARFPQQHYPSPPTSQGSRQSSNTGTPTPDGMDSGACTDKDGPPPAKRRRISKERSTRYLDLRSSDIEPEQQEELDRLLHVLHNRRKIVVVAGAGISVSAGIPDFRSSAGLFTSLKEDYKLRGSGKDLFDASVYKDDTSTSSFHDMVSSMSRMTKNAKPTAFHHMLATIASEGRLLRLYSQNVDCIDTSLEPLKTVVPLRKDDAGKWPVTVQLHGGLGKMVCSKCHELSDFDADLFSGPVPPLCTTCEEINNIRTNHEGKRSHGIGRLRPRMVLYNEHNPDQDAIGLVTEGDLRKRPDAIIVVGTTLKIPGVRTIVREMCKTVRDRRGGVAVWINNDLPPVWKDLENCFDIVVQGTSDEVANRAAMRRWWEPSDDDTYAEVSGEDVEKARAMGLEEVRIQTCTLKHAAPVSLPSLEHLNNTFRPPTHDERDLKEALPSPVEWSPMTPRKTLILKSIEKESESIAIRHGGLLTPTKSQKSSSPADRAAAAKIGVKKVAKKKQTTLQTSKSCGTAKPIKKSNVKYVKSAALVTKAKVKPKAGSKTAAKAQPAAKANQITNSFKNTKSSGMQAAKGVKKAVTPSPSKLRQVSSVSEPMLPVSPRDPRNNTSPLKHRASPSKSKVSPAKRPCFPNLENVP